MSALPAEQYRDPERVTSDAETGDVMPLRLVPAGAHCMTCRNARSSVAPFHGKRHPCEIGCMPARSGACTAWCQ